jgi:ketosteroid isomerase-like protein
MLSNARILSQDFREIIVQALSERGMGNSEVVRVDWRVTNIYRREGGGWKMVHHHTDVSPAMVEALGL